MRVRIGIFIFPKVTQLDATGPYEVFARIPGATVELIASTTAPWSPSGHDRNAHRDHRECRRARPLCVPGGGGIDALLDDAAVLDFLSRQGSPRRVRDLGVHQGPWSSVPGFCSGATAPPHIGSPLDLTLHLWRHPGRRKNRLQIAIGSPAAASPQDRLRLAVAAKIAGDEAAREIQLMMEYDPHPPFQSGSPATASPALVEQIRVKRSDFRPNGDAWWSGPLHD